MPEFPVIGQATQETLRLRRDDGSVQVTGIWIATALLVPPVHSGVVRFDRAVVGSVPSGWSVAMTHAGAPPHWEIVRDQSAPHPPFVLAQTSRDEPAGRFFLGNLGQSGDSRRRGQRCVPSSSGRHRPGCGHCVALSRSQPLLNRPRQRAEKQCRPLQGREGRPYF